MNTLSLITGIYGIFIIFIGILAVSYNPTTGYGYNPKAKSAIISGGICGGLALLWSFFLFNGQQWALTATITTTGLFLFAFSWRGSKTWSAYRSGDTTKLFPAILITTMTVASSVLLISILLLQRAVTA